MIENKKSFYFVRHGETEFNVKKILHDGADVPLNPRGRKQAETIAPIIASLPIQTVCVSPLKRALETKSIVTQNLAINEVIIEELGECPGSVWVKMSQWERDHFATELCPSVLEFFERVALGMQKALTYPSPLIVAHGGVHFALCHLIGINGYDKKINNCIPVHFFPIENEWKAKHLFLEHPPY